jgi:hypothetical protein
MLTKGLKQTNLGRKKKLGLAKKSIWGKLILGGILDSVVSKF